jgi:hypothetical protein
MKSFLLFCALASASFLGFGQTQNSFRQKDKTKPVVQAELACGQCQFKLPGKSCDLAIRLNGKAYFVDGVHIDSLGNAHADDGFCNAVRLAEVQGELVNERYQISYVQLVKPKKKKKK